MQKTILLLVILLASFNANAQRYADMSVELLSPQNGDTAYAGQMFTIDAKIKNNGIDTVKIGDSLAFELSFDGGVISFNIGGSFQPYIVLTNRELIPGDSGNMAFTFGFDTSVVADSTLLCVKVFNLNVIDTLHDTIMTNNSSCATFAIVKPASVKEIVEDVPLVKVYPNPATDIVNFDVRSKDGNTIKLQIVDITGKTVKHYAKQNSSKGIEAISVNTSDLARGMYIYTISVGEEQTRGKFEVR